MVSSRHSLPIFLHSNITQYSYLHGVLSNTASLAVVGMATIVEPAHEPAPLSTALAERHVGPRDALERYGVLGNGVGNALGVEEEGIVGKVVNGITGLVIAGVKWGAGLSAEELSLLLSLEDLGTSEESSRGNTVLEESSVVGTKREEGGDVGKTTLLVELLVVPLDLVGASGTGEVERATVAVVDA